MCLSLDTLVEAKLLRPFDAIFARTMGRLAEETRPLVLLAAAVASRYAADGQIFVPLAGLAGTRVMPRDQTPLAEMSWPELSPWISTLADSDLVSQGDTMTPLVLDRHHRLYLWRYWHSEKTLAQSLIRRASGLDESVDEARLASGLNRWFGPATPTTHPDQQKLAAAVAVLRHLTLISGGPGTGKTFTVVKILQLLVDQTRGKGHPRPRVGLLAPTGKAAAQLTDTIRRARDADGALLPNGTWPEGETPLTAQTIHRALGLGTRHAAIEVLPYDVLVVDEASMVDLVLMTQLIQALPEAAHLILLGDHHQLAAVAPGAVFGSLSRTDWAAEFSPRFKTQLQRILDTPLTSPPATAPATAPAAIGDCVVQLDQGYRFARESDIGALAQAINRGDATAAMAILADGDRPGVVYIETNRSSELDPHLDPWIHTHWEPYLTATEMSDQLHKFNQLRILCAHRQGPFGAVALNITVEKILARRGLISLKSEWYAHRPVLMTRNDYELDLFNGDVGLTTPSTPTTTELPQVTFIHPAGQLRQVSAARLSQVETAYALSVHKAQGSQFRTAIIVLPPKPSPVTTRELLYTAVTRAERQVVIMGARTTLMHAIHTATPRGTGLDSHFENTGN